MLVSFLALALAASPTAEAREHLQRGMAAYNVRNWEKAINELKAAYELDPQPSTMFSLGQAQRLSGDCASAIFSFRAFLRTASSRQAKPTQELIDGCTAQLEQEKEAKAKEAEQQRLKEEEAERAREDEARRAREEEERRAREAAAQAAATPQPAAEVAAAPAPKAAHWYSDAAFLTLGITGLAAAGAGGALLVVGNGHATGATQQATFGAYVTEAKAAPPLQIAGVAALGAGGALLVGAVVRAITFPKAPVTATVVPQRDGLGLVVGGRF